MGIVGMMAKKGICVDSRIAIALMKGELKESDLVMADLFDDPKDFVRTHLEGEVSND